MRINSVLISDDIDPICPKVLADHGIEVTQKSKLNLEQLKKEIAGHDALIVRSATKVTKDVLASTEKLKLVGRAGTGVDNIDVQEATKKGVIVMNTPAGNSRSAAELACSMILNLSRKVPQAHQSMKEGKWERKGFMGSEVYGKTLAIIGLGRIGRDVATRMQAFGMKIIAYDPMISTEKALEFGVHGFNLEEIWPLADYITLHVPLIPQTADLISAETFTKTKPGVRIVNCARGGIVNEDDLLNAIDCGICAGAALDVFTEEPPLNKALIANPNVICSPHLGASTNEAQYRVAQEIAEQIVTFNEGQRIIGALNAQALSASLDPTKFHWLATAEQFSRVLAAIADWRNHALDVVVIEFPDVCTGMESGLKASVAIGLLKHAGFSGLNFINADYFAITKGITVTAKAVTGKKITVFCPKSAEHLKVSGFASSEAGGTILSIASFNFPTGILCQGAMIINHRGDLIEVFQKKGSTVHVTDAHARLWPEVNKEIIVAFPDNQESCLGVIRSKDTGVSGDRCSIVLLDSVHDVDKLILNYTDCTIVKF